MICSPSLYNKACEIASPCRKVCALSNNQALNFRTFATFFIKRNDNTVQKAGITTLCEPCGEMEPEPIQRRLYRNAQDSQVER